MSLRALSSRLVSLPHGGGQRRGPWLPDAWRSVWARLGNSARVEKGRTNSSRDQIPLPLPATVSVHDLGFPSSKQSPSRISTIEGRIVADQDGIRLGRDCLRPTSGNQATQATSFSSLRNRDTLYLNCKKSRWPHSPIEITQGQSIWTATHLGRPCIL